MLSNPRADPGLEAFGQWLDRQVRRSSDTRSGILGAIIGTSWGMSGAAIGILSGALQVPTLALLVGLVVGGAGTTAGLIWYYRGRTQDDRELERRHGQTRSLAWRLQQQRWQGQLVLPEPSRELLESGAQAWLRALSAFDSEVWMTAGSGSTYASARNRGRFSVESAMAQLATMLASGGVSESGLDGAKKLVEEMQRIADEAQELVGHLSGRGAQTGEVESDLRFALQELRALSEAESELRQDAGENGRNG